MTGLDSALSRLLQMPRKLDRLVQQETEKTAQEALSRAQSLVPVRTGALRNSLQQSPITNGAEILARRPYAIYLEYGTRRMSARPFLLPALQESDYSARMTRAMQEAIL